MPSRIDEAGHTKAFDYPVAEHWGESQRTKRCLVGFEPTSAHTYESEIQRSTTYATPTPPTNDHCESEIKDRLVTVLHSVEQHADVLPAQLRFLSYSQKEVTEPTVPSHFEWKGSVVKAVMGQGKLYVLVAGTTEVGIAFVPSFKTCYCLI